MQLPDVDTPCLRVSRTGTRWTVTHRGFAGSLGNFESRDDALDYARSVAINSAEAVVEAEDDAGRLDMRQSFTTSITGTVTVTTFPYEVFLPAHEDERRADPAARHPAGRAPTRHPSSSAQTGRHDRS